MRPGLVASSYHVDQVAVLRLAGNLTGRTVAALRSSLAHVEPVLESLLRDRPPVLIVDLSPVTTCDRWGLAILSAIGDAAVQAGALPRLAAARPAVRSAILVGGLCDRLAQYVTVGGAARDDPAELVHG